MFFNLTHTHYRTIHQGKLPRAELSWWPLRSLSFQNCGLNNLHYPAIIIAIKRINTVTGEEGFLSVLVTSEPEAPSANPGTQKVLRKILKNHLGISFKMIYSSCFTLWDSQCLKHFFIMLIVTCLISGTKYPQEATYRRVSLYWAMLYLLSKPRESGCQTSRPSLGDLLLPEKPHLLKVQQTSQTVSTCSNTQVNGRLMCTYYLLNSRQELRSLQEQANHSHGEQWACGNTIWITKTAHLEFSASFSSNASQNAVIARFCFIKVSFKTSIV